MRRLFLNHMSDSVSNNSLARYFTTQECARILGVEPARVYDWRRNGLVQPALTKGLVQYDRAALARMALLVALGDVFGLNSAVPAATVRDNENVEKLDALMAHLEHAPDDDGDVTLNVTAPHVSGQLRIPLVPWLKPGIASVPV